MYMGKTLNIAVICDSIDTTLGGSYISAQRFAKGLIEEWHKIIWCTSTFIDEQKKKEFWHEKIYEFRSLFGVGPQKIRFAYPRLADIIDIFQKEHIDIVYNIHPSYIGWQAYRAAKKNNIPIVSHSHVYTQLLVPGLPKAIQKIIKNIIARFYRKCDGIVYPTNFAKKDFEEYHFKNKEIVISNGVDLKVFQPIKRTIDAKWNILYVGRLDQEKNIPLLLEALHILNVKDSTDKIQCTIIWRGSEEKKLRAMVKSYGLTNHVHFTGKISLSKVIESYQHCSMYVLTSLYELESMSTLEAMACGCPILIANSEHSAAKFFVQGNWYLFNPYKAEDLAEKINSLRTNPEKIQEMREKSKEQVANFSFERSIKKLSEFFISFCTT